MNLIDNLIVFLNKPASETQIREMYKDKQIDVETIRRNIPLYRILWSIKLMGSGLKKKGTIPMNAQPVATKEMDRHNEKTARKSLLLFLI